MERAHDVVSDDRTAVAKVSAQVPAERVEYNRAARLRSVQHQAGPEVPERLHVLRPQFVGPCNLIPTGREPAPGKVGLCSLWLGREHFHLQRHHMAPSRPEHRNRTPLVY